MEQVMRNIPAILLAGLIAVAAAFAIGTFTAQEAYADEHTHEGWTEWTETEYLPWETGSYYLTEDVTLDSTWDINRKTINLCLNGHSITCQESDSIVIYITKGDLSLYNCGTDGKIEGTGTGVYLDDGTFNMYGGTISGNSADGDGGGVYLNHGTFNMFGGTISGNSATRYGGGVYVASGTFNMSGGTISGNSAKFGGGVDLIVGTFNMSGGTITGNSASASGGGIFLHESNIIQLSGSPKITGNTVKHKANNIYLAKNAKAKITNKLTTPGGTSKPQIGISMYSKGVFTQDLSGSLVDGTTVKDLFSSDCLAYILTETDNHEAQLERVVDMSGEGTEDSPYEITKYADLQEFAAIVNGTHLKAPKDTDAYGKLMNDIVSKNSPGDTEYAHDWTPIGTSSDPYIGHFDGDSHFIKGLSNEEQTNVSNADYQGLFGCIGKQDDTVKGEVKNVGLEGGKIIGKSYVGGVVGYNIGGEITNCYNTGAVSGIGIDVGGVAGQNNGGTITNCYNTGAVSGNGYVGGVVGYNIGGEITNCYNTGAVRGAGGIVGGVAGYNSSDITNCYNTGAVSGTGYVGGVAGNNNGTIDYCYYNKELNVVKAIGSGTAGTNVEGLETSQMVGAAALNNMTFSYESPSENPWLTKEDGKDADSGTYYEYYPHLKGFAYDISKKAADWPGKLTTSADWSDDAVSYIYNGSAQGPKVTKVISSPKPVEIPDGMTAEWRKKIVEDVDNPEWGETICDEPSLSGVYKLTIKDPKDGDKVIEEIVYIILKKKNSSNSNDYNVKYQVQKKTAGGGTEWSDIDSKDIVDVGNYKAVIELTGRPDLEEKEFQITPIPLKVTINGSSAQKTYNGKQQTYTGTVTVTSQDKAFDTSKFRYTGSTVVKGTKAGTYTTKLTAKDCAYSDSHYGLQVTVGSPIKLTITENKKPEPKPVVNKAAAKIALDAGVVAKSSGSKVTASWGAVKGASSYVIYANYCGKKTLKKIKTVSGKTTSFDITKLNGKKFNPKKNLKFYVVAYKTVKGKKVKLAKSIMAHAPGSKNSKRTNVTGVKVKKASFKLKKGKTAKLKAKLVLQKKGKKPLKHCAKFRYASSNKKVAKVSKKGKITAVGKGKCTVYVYAVSGNAKKIKVTVK